MSETQALEIQTSVNPFSDNMRMVEFANNVDSDKAAHNEPPHLNLHCFPLIIDLPK